MQTCLEGERLRDAVQAQWPRVTMKQFAARMGVKPVLLSMFINGHRRAPDGFWLAAAAELGVEPRVIFQDRVAA